MEKTGGWVLLTKCVKSDILSKDAGNRPVFFITGTLAENELTKIM